MPKDFKAYKDILRHMAVSLGIQAEILQENTHKLVDILQLSAPGTAVMHF